MKGVSDSWNLRVPVPSFFSKSDKSQNVLVRCCLFVHLEKFFLFPIRKKSQLFILSNFCPMATLTLVWTGMEMMWWRAVAKSWRRVSLEEQGVTQISSEWMLHNTPWTRDDRATAVLPSGICSLKGMSKGTANISIEMSLARSRVRFYDLTSPQALWNQNVELTYKTKNDG